jgi:hypothetical protein
MDSILARTDNEQIMTSPHCNVQVIHAPGECYYCDTYAPDQQSARIASNTPFTPNEANGWEGNVAQKSPFIACGTSKATSGWYCSGEMGHDGPCAAWPVSHAAADSMNLRPQRMDFNVPGGGPGFREASRQFWRWLTRVR